MAKIYRNVLLVEGKQDVFVVPELIEANGVNWGTKKNPIVHIQHCEGHTNLIDPDVISTQLQASGLSVLGIMVDADDDPLSRWQSVRNACLKSIPDMPSELPEIGLIHSAPNGVRFGVWLMPDNKLRGMLETFLSCMIPNDSEPLWQYAQEVAPEARRRGAPFKDTHHDKAKIYSWLAWQAPPGRQLHQAIKECILNPTHPKAQIFVSWFKALYGL